MSELPSRGWNAGGSLSGEGWLRVDYEPIDGEVGTIMIEDAEGTKWGCVVSRDAVIPSGRLIDRETELTEERFDVVSWTGVVGTPQVRRFVTALEIVDAASMSRAER